MVSSSLPRAGDLWLDVPPWPVQLLPLDCSLLLGNRSLLARSRMGKASTLGACAADPAGTSAWRALAYRGMRLCRDRRTRTCVGAGPALFGRGGPHRLHAS